ncbi:MULTISPECIES: peptidylprolyl isomerase [unclassified Alteromonas]|uniref:peptidylprolyl isomerase n=1 Tax=unclassified Alteromonas TaxID=2614992 RepID=UPI000C4AD2CC|nr:MULTISPECIES: peptidylprolyl isomerase [unclassified Alteromonas]MBT81340.1 peptidylprolyl isomerase [Alteromonadaceae bacterium]MEC7689710.1 peptidylprolyl isomerase [Pseudomonadota bacterium]AYA63165.1 peptidyl-prolyl cis-trans isomerase [Alteromonas sp. RKMC-009]MBT82692.1 peptidylprolyl isomerase [Alteromonadaceae bacterium]MDO6475808.1 peptidylprolyl isomerase [Alteromonas sp. 1_MG-2023]
MLRALLLALVVVTTPVIAAKPKDDGSQIQPDNYYPRVKMETTMGDFVVELYRRRAPITVNNFLRYVDKKSYNGTIFHRVVPGYIVQGGGYNAEFDEKPDYGTIFNESGSGMSNKMYTVSMARQNDPHSATRQFFFNMNDNTNLDPGRDWGYSVFGMIVEGEAVVEKMMEVELDYQPALGEPNSPKEPIILKSVTLLPAV